jgi:hypothetical protein
MNWFDLTGDRDMGCCECGDEPPDSTKRGEFLDQLKMCFSRRTLLHGLATGIILILIIIK